LGGAAGAILSPLFEMCPPKKIDAASASSNGRDIGFWLTDLRQFQPAGSNPASATDQEFSLDRVSSA
jgi:hypothetical protein